MKTPECKNCGSLRTSRVERKGFLQKTIFPGFGYYPWQCSSCWKSFYAKERGHRVRSPRRASDRLSAEHSD